MHPHQQMISRLEAEEAVMEAELRRAIQVARLTGRAPEDYPPCKRAMYRVSLDVQLDAMIEIFFGERSVDG